MDISLTQADAIVRVMTLVERRRKLDAKIRTETRRAEREAGVSVTGIDEVADLRAEVARLRDALDSTNRDARSLAEQAASAREWERKYWELSRQSNKWLDKPEFTDEEKQELMAQRLIACIKLVRARTGLGLRESKEVVDHWRNRLHELHTV